MPTNPLTPISKKEHFGNNFALSFQFSDASAPTMELRSLLNNGSGSESVTANFEQILGLPVSSTVEDIFGSNRIQKSVRMLESTEATLPFDVSIDHVDEYEPYEDRVETIVVPVVFAIIFIVGILGNGTLVIIFLRHRGMRNIPNT